MDWQRCWCHLRQRIWWVALLAAATVAALISSWPDTPFMQPDTCRRSLCCVALPTPEGPPEGGRVGEYCCRVQATCITATRGSKRLTSRYLYAWCIGCMHQAVAKVAWGFECGLPNGGGAVVVVLLVAVAAAHSLGHVGTERMLPTTAGASCPQLLVQAAHNCWCKLPTTAGASCPQLLVQAAHTGVLLHLHALLVGIGPWVPGVHGNHA